MQASGWGQHLKRQPLNVKIFFPVQSACYLDNSRRFVASGAERVSMAVPNKQALSLTVSRVLLLLLPSLCSPYPLPPPPPPLTSLPSFNIRFLFSRVCCSAGFRPSQPSDRLTFLSLFSRQFFFPNSLLLLSSSLILSTAFTFYCLSLPSSMLMLYLTLVCLVFRKTVSDRAASVLSVLVAHAWDMEDQCAVVPPCRSEALSIM